MKTKMTRAVHDLLAERQALAGRERALIEALNRVLPEMGYRVVPAAGNHRAPAKAAPRRRTRRLLCRQCNRRFALPLHLARHTAAAHKRGRKAA